MLRNRLQGRRHNHAARAAVVVGWLKLCGRDRPKLVRDLQALGNRRHELPVPDRRREESRQLGRDLGRLGRHALAVLDLRAEPLISQRSATLWTVSELEWGILASLHVPQGGRRPDDAFGGGRAASLRLRVNIQLGIPGAALRDTGADTRSRRVADGERIKSSTCPQPAVAKTLQAPAADDAGSHLCPLGVFGGPRRDRRPQPTRLLLTAQALRAQSIPYLCLRRPPQTFPPSCCARTAVRTPAANLPLLRRCGTRAPSHTSSALQRGRRRGPLGGGGGILGEAREELEHAPQLAQLHLPSSPQTPHRRKQAPRNTIRPASPAQGHGMLPQRLVKPPHPRLQPFPGPGPAGGPLALLPLDGLGSST